MFGIGWTELVFLSIAALLVLGPEKLPQLARQLGKWTRDLRAVSADLRREFNAEFDEVDDSGFSAFSEFSEPQEDDLTLTRDGFGETILPDHNETDDPKTGG